MHPSLSFLALLLTARMSYVMSVRPQVARVRTDPHSPNQYRVEGTLYNIPEFAKAFQCKKGAKLNPPEEKRCRLW